MTNVGLDAQGFVMKLRPRTASRGLNTLEECTKMRTVNNV